MSQARSTSLKTRLMLIVFISALVIGGITLLLILNITYRHEREENEQQIKQLMETVSYTAAIAAYSGNTEIANDVVKGLMLNNVVCQINLRNNLSLNVTSARHDKLDLPALQQAGACSLTISRALVSPFDSNEIIGRLEARIDSGVIKADAIHNTGRLAFSLIAFLLLPLVVWYAISRLITDPIARLSQQLHHLVPGSGSRIDEPNASTSKEVAQLTLYLNELLYTVERQLQDKHDQLLLTDNLKDKYHYLAHHDTLTGLPNRVLFADRLGQMLAHSKRNNLRCAIMFIDLDDFKIINDTLGHAIGDLALKEFVQRTQVAVRESDTVARLGGVEFVVLLPEIDTSQDAVSVAEKILLTISQPFEIAGHTLKMSASIGVAVYPEHGTDEFSLVKRADIAMYQAKSSGRNTARLYRQE